MFLALHRLFNYSLIEEHIAPIPADMSEGKVIILSWNFPFAELVSELKNITVMLFMK